MAVALRVICSTRCDSRSSRKSFRRLLESRYRFTAVLEDHLGHGGTFSDQLDALLPRRDPGLALGHTCDDAARHQVPQLALVAFLGRLGFGDGGEDADRFAAPGDRDGLAVLDTAEVFAEFVLQFADGDVGHGGYIV